jgi:hypothetical protein
MRRFAVSLVVIAVIAIGGFLFRDYLKSNAAELRAGDCFDEPANATDTIEDVQHHPCTEAHQYEVILVSEHPAAKGAAYPSDDEMDAWVGDQCVSVFRTYTGLDPATDPVVGLGYYRATSDGWKDGSRKVICYVGRNDGTKVSQSLKVSK